MNKVLLKSIKSFIPEVISVAFLTVIFSLAVYVLLSNFY